MLKLLHLRCRDVELFFSYTRTHCLAGFFGTLASVRVDGNGWVGLPLVLLFGDRRWEILDSTTVHDVVLTSSGAFVAQVLSSNNKLESLVQIHENLS